MLASRLVKSCLFLVIALTPIAAKASFVIDAFNGPVGSSSSYVLANGLSVSRTISAVGPVSFTGNGTAMVVTNNGPASGLSGIVMNYTFNPGAIGADKKVGQLTFQFGQVTGTWQGTIRLFDSANNLLALAGGAPISNGILNVAAPLLGSTKRIQINYSPVAAGVGSIMTLSTITATPEPTTLLLFGGIAGFGFIARRRVKVRVA